MHSYIQPLANEFEKAANANDALQMKAYMKNQFEFYGIKTPQRKAITKAYLKQHPLNSIKDVEAMIYELWHLPQREFQYAAIELTMLYKKVWQSKTIELIEYCILHKSWWDTVDALAIDGAGTYFKLFPEKISFTQQWNESGNMWLQRASLLFQNKYKQTTDKKLLSRYILHVSGSKEFFLRKAIGWCLREYAKTNAEWVSTFVHQHSLSPLSKKEALKNIEE